MRTYTFTLPSGGKLKMRELSAEQIIQVMDRWGDKFGRIADELAKASVLSVDEVPWTGANRDTEWNALPAKDRALITEAYGRIHNPTDDERSSFFDSMTITEE